MTQMGSRSMSMIGKEVALLDIKDQNSSENMISIESQKLENLKNVVLDLARASDTVVSQNTFLLQRLSQLENGNDCNKLRGEVSTDFKFTPLFDRVVVEYIETDVKKNLEKSQEKLLEGIVVAVGPGCRIEDGKTLPPVTKVGDHVALPPQGGLKIVVNEKEYYIYRESDIIGKFD